MQPRRIPSLRQKDEQMVTVYDVPAEKLILKVSEKLKENDKIVPPEWAEFAKTGIHTERAPVQQDWWYTRAASIMRKLYVKGPMEPPSSQASTADSTTGDASPTRQSREAATSSGSVSFSFRTQASSRQPRTSREGRSPPPDRSSSTTLPKRYLTNLRTEGNWHGRRS